MSALLSWVMGAMGLYLMVWAVRTGRGMAAPTSPSAMQAAAGQQVLVVGEVLAPPQHLASPLQGLTCVYWHVRAVRIRERNASARASGVQVQVDVAVSSEPAFVVRTAEGDVTVEGSAGRMASGLQVVHRDQASFARSLNVAGQTYELPPVAHGTRQVQEGTLLPGQTVWVQGTLQNGSSGIVVAGVGERPLVIDTTPLASRRRRGAVIVGLSAVVGVVLVGAAVAMSVG